MTGTIINSVVILAAGFFGCVIKKAIPEKIEKPIMDMIGVSVFLIALLGFFSTALTIVDGAIKSNGEIMMLVCLAFGVAIGELLCIEDKLNAFGKKVEEKAGVDGFAKGFVTASLLFCVGAMTIVGSLQAGLSGDYEMIFTKSVLDFISSMVFASSLGIGVMLSAAFVFVFQGAIVLMAQFVAPFLTDAVIAEMVCSGSIIIFALGMNIVGITKLKVINYLPAIFLPVVLCPVLANFV